MKNLLLIFTFLLSSSSIISQTKEYNSEKVLDNEILEYLNNKEKICDEIKNYISTPLFIEQNKFNIYLIRTGCSISNDYLLFKNDKLFNITESTDIKTLITTLNTFISKIENNEIVLNYLEKLIEIHKDNVQFNSKKKRKISIVKKSNNLNMR